MARLTTFVASATTILSTAMGAQFVLYTPGGDDTAVERIDPIITPGTISGHVHQVFGANRLSANMSYDSLQEADCTTVGDANGAGNALDKSVYWHPALFMQASSGSGYIRVPTNGHKMYYRDVGSDSDKLASPFEFPHDFRMVAGNPFMREAASDVSQQGITQWTCHDGTDITGDQGGFPTGVSDCQSYPYFTGTIHFPHCWNGEDFNQEDPTAHMSYPEGDIQGGNCPSSHPIRLPHIFQEHFFDIHSVVDKVKPDSFVLAQGDDTGFGWHADFFNGWADGAIPELFDTCPQPEWGNEDVGTCPSFTAFSTPNADCKLGVTYKENINTPTLLPGCNPISNINPAPRLAIAALGVETDQCAAAVSSSGGSVASSVSAVASSAAAYQPPTTLITSAAVVASALTGNNIVWVTSIVTVVARDAEATPVPKIGRSRIMRHL